MKNFIFDFYNTLVSIRTDEHRQESWYDVCEFLEKRGMYAEPSRLISLYDEGWALLLDELSKTSGYAYPEGDITYVYKHMANALGGELSESDAKTCALLARKQSVIHYGLFDGTVELLRELKSRGAKLYILSNAQSAFTPYELGLTNIADLFDGILLSSDYGCRKPDRAFFDILFKKYKLKKAQSVMIGDDISSDGKGAADFGIKYVYAGGGAAAHADEILSLSGADKL